MYWNHMGWGWGSGIMMIIWIALLITVILLVVHSAQQTARYPFQQESAIDILKKRYARGEISKAEFEERKKDLI